MKKIMLLLFALLLMFTMGGCSSKNGSTQSSVSSSTESVLVESMTEKRNLPKSQRMVQTPTC